MSPPQCTAWRSHRHWAGAAGGGIKGGIRISYSRHVFSEESWPQYFDYNLSFPLSLQVLRSATELKPLTRQCFAQLVGHFGSMNHRNQQGLLTVSGHYQKDAFLFSTQATLNSSQTESKPATRASKVHCSLHSCLFVTFLWSGSFSLVVFQHRNTFFCLF